VYPASQTQSVNLSLPIAEVDPDGHDVQVLRSGPFHDRSIEVLYVPRSHATHACVNTFPVGSHAPAPVYPAVQTQSVNWSLDIAENDPDGHDVQVRDPIEVLYVPRSHATHASLTPVYPAPQTQSSKLSLPLTEVDIPGHESQE
jgi:hypothetical protein